MKISPRELREAQIPTKAFGFDRDVVDALLERAADTVEGLIEENRQLFEALERVQSGTVPAAQNIDQAQMVVEPAESFEDAMGAGQLEVQAVSQSDNFESSLDISNEMTSQILEKEALINRTLMLAQKTADETLRAAKEEADELIIKSEAAAKELVDQASAEAQHLSGTAKEEAELALTQAKEQAQQMVSSARTEATEIVEKAQQQANEMYKAETDKFVDLVERLNTEREQLISDIELLQNFDSEHRAKLTALVEEDLSKLVARETFNVDELPDISDLPKILESAKYIETPVMETVAQAQLDGGETLEVVEALNENDIIDSIDADIELEDMSELSKQNTSVVEPAGMQSEDPFADFVNSQVSPAEASTVAPAGSDKDENHEKNFQPNLANENSDDDLDDDDFFASLREAVNDESPLGENNSDDGKSSGTFKNFFDK
jgi:cell division septum initiation protein DivIVA